MPFILRRRRVDTLSFDRFFPVYYCRDELGYVYLNHNRRRAHVFDTEQETWDAEVAWRESEDYPSQQHMEREMSITRYEYLKVKRKKKGAA